MKRTLILVLILLIGLELNCISPKRFIVVQKDFKELLFFKESSCNYFKIHKSGAMGGYGFMEPTLLDIGIPITRNQFIKNPKIFTKELQERALDSLLKYNEVLLQPIIKKYIWKTITPKGYGEITITRAGLLAAAHLAGAGGVINYFRYGTNPKDLHGTSLLTYMKAFEKTKITMNIHPKTKEAYQLMHEGVLALARAEQQGIRCDVTYLEKSKVRLTRKIERLENEFKDSDFFKEWQRSAKSAVNINSDKQLGDFLYGVKGIKPSKLTPSGKGSTDEEALSQLNLPELNNLLQVSKLKKLRDTYLEGFLREQVDGYIHPFFNLHLVKTFRSSSDHPNFQNIPIRDEESRVCRETLFARPGHQLLEIDFKGIEVGINACYNKDPNLVAYVNNPALDMHRDMAQQIFFIDNFDKTIPAHKTLRNAAKNGFVFPQFYGDYFRNCASNLACEWGKLPKGKWSEGQGIDFNGYKLSDHLIVNGIKSLTAFEKHIQDIETDFWGNRFKVYKRWKDKWYNDYLQKGYIDLLTGFRCSGAMKKNDVTNYPGQGSAFHCLLWSFIQVDKLLMDYDSKLIGQIHDSMIIDCNPKETYEIASKIKDITTKRLPEHFRWINVAMNVDMEATEVDCSWATKKSFSI
jgi:hypothetical protein